jgi:hypothetical protein
MSSVGESEPTRRIPRDNGAIGQDEVSCAIVRNSAAHRRATRWRVCCDCSGGNCDLLLRGRRNARAERARQKAGRTEADQHQASRFVRFAAATLQIKSASGSTKALPVHTVEPPALPT